MKYWLSHLPLEVWVDVFRYPWTSREELGRIVDRFCNRKYTEYLQFYLHDWGKRMLNQLYFCKGGLYKSAEHEQYRSHNYVDFPLAPMPGNINTFERISISHFDAQTLNFLHQIGPILTNVNLNFCHLSPNNTPNLRLIVAHLLPLLNSIHSLCFDVRALPTVRQCFGADRLAKLKVLEPSCQGMKQLDGAAVQALVNFLVNWLTLPEQDDIGPRFCVCKAPLPNVLFEKISSAVRQEFLAAKTPCKFAVIFLLNHWEWEKQQFADEFHLNNDIDEELHCAQIREHGFLQITRHPANCAIGLRECIEAAAEKDQAQIRIINPTVGYIDSLDAEEEDVHQQPSTTIKEEPSCSLI